MHIKVIPFGSILTLIMGCPIRGDEIGLENSSETDTGGSVPDCGDGLVQSPEECDEGSLNGVYNIYCNDNCEIYVPSERCGDGNLQEAVFGVFTPLPRFWEGCDDGNFEDGDGCSSSCKLEFPPQTCDSEEWNSPCASCAFHALREECGPLNACDTTCQNFLSCLEELSYPECLELNPEGALKANSVLGALHQFPDPHPCWEECSLYSNAAG